MNKKVGKAFRVRINSILPGLIQTDMGDQTFVNRACDLGTNDVDAARQLALSGHPIGRLGVPDTTEVETNRSP